MRGSPSFEGYGGRFLRCDRARTTDLSGFAADPRAVEWADFRDHYPRCPDCSREVGRLGALLGALRFETSSASAHVADRQLLALYRSPDQLPREESERIALHLAGCAPCRTELAVLERFDFAALAAEARAPGPAARLLGALRRIPAALWSTLPRPVLAALLAVIVAVPVLLVWRTLPKRDADTPRLARIEPEVKAPPVPIEPPESPRTTAPAERAQALPPTEPAKPVAQKPPPPATRAPVPEATEQPAPEPARTLEIAALIPADAPIYAAGAVSGGSVRIGSVSRGGLDAAAPQVLAPERGGSTAHPAPTLYWFLPDATPLSAEVTLVDPNGVDPLLEHALEGPLAAGVHTVRLAEHGVRLAPGVEYQWFVALVVDPARRARDVVSGGSIRYVAADPVANLPPARRAHAYAEAGLWYDAFDQLSIWLAAEPHAAVLHAHRAALLEQVGLDKVARYERGVASRAE